MNIGRIWLLVAAVFLTSQALAGSTAEEVGRPQGSYFSNRPIGVIFDTDIWSDIDDAMALAMLHALEDRGEIKLLAVTISTNSSWCASYVDLLDTFYGHPLVPLGMIHEGNDLDDFRKRFPELKLPFSRYTQLISERKKSDGSWVYPHRVTESSAVPESVALLRKTLSSQPDGSVVMIEVGYSTNLARLLMSTPDAISALDGRKLVEKKVRLLSIMAGSFGDFTDGETFWPKGSPETNLKSDVHSAQVLFENWPTPIVASGIEIGGSLLYPPESIRHDFEYVHDHPIADTYRTYCREQNLEQHGICLDAHGTFDLTAVLYAARPDRNYFSVSAPGKITVLDDGGSRFEENAAGKHRHLVLDDTQKTRTLEALVMLVTQPPTQYPEALTGDHANVGRD